MKSYLRHIPVFALMAILLLTSCKKDEAKLIPRGKMARIYAEMLATDQWVNSNPTLKTMADTSMVYEPILRKYGYDSYDYRHSVGVYMNDPERFARILRTSAQLLGDRIKELERLKKEQEEAAERRKITVFLDIQHFFPYLEEEAYVHYHDSLKVEYDTLGAYKIVPVENADTVYEGLHMIIKVDSLSLKDTIVSGALTEK